jgi:hypothetical protein
MKTIIFWTLAIFVTVWCMALTACSSTPIVKTVEVPVAVKCTPPVIPKPAFQYPGCVVPGETLFNLAKCALADLRLHMGYEQELEAGLTSCSQ